MEVIRRLLVIAESNATVSFERMLVIQIKCASITVVISETHLKPSTRPRRIWVGVWTSMIIM